jgi:hypothetical protein
MIFTNPNPLDSMGTSLFTSTPWTKRKISQLRAKSIDTYYIATEEISVDLPTTMLVQPNELPPVDILLIEELEDIVDIRAARIADDEQGEDIPYSELRKKLGFTDKWPTE